MLYLLNVSIIVPIAIVKTQYDVRCCSWAVKYISLCLVRMSKEEKEAALPPNEDSIRVICRFRPLNDTEEKTGSKFVVKFPSGTDDQCVSIGVGCCVLGESEIIA